MNGLYLVEPYGQKIADGEMTAIAKAKPLDLAGEHILVSGKLAYGTITLDQPEQVDIKAFEDRESEHCIPRSDRLGWWTDTEELYLYKVLSFDAYEQPKKVTVPPGTQTKMAEVIFDGVGETAKQAQSQHQADSAHADLPSEKAYTSTVVALDIPDELAQQLAIPGGMSPEEMHITLCYLGNISRLADDRALIEQVISRIAQRSTPIAGTVGGVILFNTPDGIALTAHFDSPQLADFQHSIAQTFESLGIDTASYHGFTPHVTLGYYPDKESLPEIEIPDRPIVLDTLSLLWAGDKIDYPFGMAIGAKPWTVDDPPPPAINWTATEKEKCTAAANAVLADGGTEQEAIYACIHAAGKGEKEMDEETKAWDGSATRYESTDQYCAACLIDVNSAAGREEKAQSHCMLPVKNPGSDAYDFEGIQAAAGGRGISRVKKPTDVPQEAWDKAVSSAASTIAAQYKENDRNPPPNVQQMIGKKEEQPGLLKGLADEIVKAFKALGLSKSDAPPTSDSPKNSTLETALKALENQESVAFAFKAADSNMWWFQFTTNAFRDRELEIFTTKSIEDYVNRHEDQDEKGEFWFWHIPGSKFGTVKWQAMAGRFLAQAGPFDDTKIGETFKEFFSEYPLSHPTIAPEGWGTSHGYKYWREDRQDGVYNWFDIHESTVLPLSIASNQWNPMPLIIQEAKTMNEKQKAALEAIAPGLADMVTEAGEQRTKDLETMDVAFKETTEEKAKTSMCEKLRAMAKETDGKMAEQLTAMADEMEAEEETKTDEPAEETKSDPVADLRAEVSDALKAVMELVTEQTTAFKESLPELVTEAIQPVVDEVKALKESDAEKVAQIANETPAASLSALVRGQFGEKTSQIKSTDDLVKGPTQTPVPERGVTGVPFIDSFMAGTDQRR